MYILKFIGAFAIIVASNMAMSQELIYTPVNPSFGGNPFNSSHLLTIAEVDRPDPPQSDSPFSSSFEQSQADLFTRQLESRILSQLSFDIVDQIFDGDAQNGVFEFDTTSIAFERLLDGAIRLTITDGTDGGVTNILIPSFLASSD